MITKVINEVPLEQKPSQTIELPRGATILGAYLIDKGISLVVMLSPANPAEKRHISIYGTGDPIDGNGVLHHITSIQTGFLVWHIFERKL